MAGALAAGPALAVERYGWVLAGVGAAGVAALALGLMAGDHGLLAWGLAFVGGEYGASLFVPERDLDAAAPLYAAGLVLTAELAYWTVELRSPVLPERGVLARRVILVAAIATGALPLASAVLAASALPGGGGVVWDAVGVVAALGLLVLIARLARASPERSR